MTDELSAIKLADIIIDPEHNPRATIEKLPFEQLVASIKQNGITQPVLVTPAEKAGKFKLIAGERRTKAAKEAGLKEIPALIRESVNGNAAVLALTENLLREDLSPVEEAEAFKALQEQHGWNQKEVAAKLGVSQSRVSERLGLLKLPEASRVLIARGDVKLDHARALRDVAAVSPEFADALAAAVGDDPSIEHGHVREAIANCTGTAVEVNHRVSFDEVEDLLDDDQVSAWKRFWPQNWEGPRLSGDVLDAARQYGCLVSVECDNGSFKTVEHILTDAEFVVAQIEAQIEAERNQKQPAADKPAEVKGAERDAREMEIAQRARVHELNIEIGSKLTREFYAPEITTDRMKILARMIIDANDHRHLGFASLALIDERAIEVSEKGKIKVMKSPDAKQRLLDHLDGADTPQEVLGVMMVAIVGSQLASGESLPPSGRPFYSLPGEYGKPNEIRQAALAEALTVFTAGDTHDRIKAQLDAARGDDDE